MTEKQEELIYADLDMVENKEKLINADLDMAEHQEKLINADLDKTEDQKKLINAKLNIIENQEKMINSDMDIVEYPEKLINANLDIGENQEKLINANVNMAEHQKKLINADLDMTKSQEKLIGINLNIVENQDKLNDADSHMAENQDKLSDAYSDIIEHQDKLNGIDSDMAENQDKLNDADSDMAENQDKLNDADSDMAENQDKLNDADSDMAENQDKLNDADSDMAENQDKLNDADSDMAENQDKLSDAYSDMIGHQDKLIGTDSDIAENQDKFSDTDSDMAENQEKYIDEGVNLLTSDNKMFARLRSNFNESSNSDKGLDKLQLILEMVMGHSQMLFATANQNEMTAEKLITIAKKMEVAVDNMTSTMNSLKEFKNSLSDLINSVVPQIKLDKSLQNYESKTTYPTMVPPPLSPTTNRAMDMHTSMNNMEFKKSLSDLRNNMLPRIKLQNNLQHCQTESTCPTMVLPPLSLSTNGVMDTNTSMNTIKEIMNGLADLRKSMRIRTQLQNSLQDSETETTCPIMDQPPRTPSPPKPVDTNTSMNTIKEIMNGLADLRKTVRNQTTLQNNLHNYETETTCPSIVPPPLSPSTEEPMDTNTSMNTIKNIMNDLADLKNSMKPQTQLQNNLHDCETEATYPSMIQGAVSPSTNESMDTNTSMNTIKEIMNGLADLRNSMRARIQCQNNLQDSETETTYPTMVPPPLSTTISVNTNISKTLNPEPNDCGEKSVDSTLQMSPADLAITKFRIDTSYKLTNKMNVNLWLEYLKMELACQDLLDLIDDNTPAPPDLSEASKIKRINLVRRIIVDSVDKKYRDMIISINSPKAMILKLLEAKRMKFPEIKKNKLQEFKKNKLLEIKKSKPPEGKKIETIDVHAARNRFYQLRMKKSETATHFVERFESALRQYEESLGAVPLTEREKRSAFHQALIPANPELANLNLVRKLMAVPELSYHQLKLFLIQMETQKRTTGISLTDETKKIQVPFVKEATPRCHRCYKTNHWTTECFLKQTNQWFCYKCNCVTDHKGKNCFKINASNSGAQYKIQNKNTFRSNEGAAISKVLKLNNTKPNFKKRKENAIQTFKLANIKKSKIID